MQPPPFPHAGPLLSIATRPGAPRSISMVEALGEIFGWLTRRPPTAREKQLEAKAIERLAAELREAAEVQDAKDKTGREQN
jgi:hypothetical protein